ncbi:MAG: biosynthetic-type acetolactate synthase large subunit [Bacteroides sp.]|nr:biosynthetic-type acetolactate synthase large subunit [Bacteroides sp.]MBD5354553.1 biosynthetic-type acetolactate synthase large subunit [Bacteroides sp.]
MSERITGSEAICRALLAEGVDTIFGYPGGQIMPFYDKLYDFSDDLHHILTRHEQGAVHAAQGYARASGKVGVVTVTSGPAATNIITGVADANVDCTPLVVITGQVAVNSLGTDAFQETDVMGITLPITKWAYQIRRPEEIPWAIARAFYIASTGRPGPVVLDVTRDAQVGTLDWSYDKINYIRSYNPDPELLPGDVLTAASLLNRAERPMIIAGHGVMLSNAEKELITLAEKADIPVATTLLGLSDIPSDHPLNKGMVGMHGNIGPNLNTNRADVILAIGLRFDDRVTGVVKQYAPDAKIIHVDIDRAEFNKNVKAHTAIHADARKALQALLPLVNKSKHTEWLATFDRPEEIERTMVMKRELDPEDLGPDSPMRMGEVVRKISEASANRGILVTDVGQNQMMSARYFKYTLPKSVITSGGLGTMGFCLPAAIGAKIACPERDVFAFMGDGGFQMTMQELGTMLAYNIGVKVIILNNDFLGNVRQWQAMFYNNRFSATPMINPDFVTIAHAYGFPAERVANRSELPAAIERMMSTEGTYLLDVNIEPEDMVFPMIVPGAAVDDILVNATTKYQA